MPATVQIMITHFLRSRALKKNIKSIEEIFLQVSVTDALLKLLLKNAN